MSSSLIAEAVKASAIVVLGRRSSVFDLDGRTYALEHTVVEVFDGQIRKENASKSASAPVRYPIYIGCARSEPAMQRSSSALPGLPIPSLRHGRPMPPWRR
jgi:hypothetical protein